MDEPVEKLWQVSYTPGVTEEQANRIAKSATDDGICEYADTIDPQYFYTIHYDRSTVEGYRHILMKVLGGEPLTEKNKFSLRELLKDYDEWLEKRAYPREKYYDLDEGWFDFD